MRKVKLDVDCLQVESFPITDGARAGRGTVHGPDTPTTTYPTDPYSFSGDPQGCLCTNPGPSDGGSCGSC